MMLDANKLIEAIGKETELSTDPSSLFAEGYIAGLRRALELIKEQDQPIEELLTMKEKWKAREVSAYYEGLSTAWQLAQKLLTPEEKGGYSASMLMDIFDVSSGAQVILTYPCTMVMAQINLWRTELLKEKEQED